jgi:hypothetical protein
MLERIMTLEKKIDVIERQAHENIRKKKKLRRKAQEIKRDLQVLICCNFSAAIKVVRRYMDLRHL